jgi:hypothetical protein
MFITLINLRLVVIHDESRFVMLIINLPMRGSALFAPYTSVSEPCIVVTKQIGNPWRCLECGWSSGRCGWQTYTIVFVILTKYVFSVHAEEKGSTFSLYLDSLKTFLQGIPEEMQQFWILISHCKYKRSPSNHCLIRMTSIDNCCLLTSNLRSSVRCVYILLT